MSRERNSGKSNNRNSERRPSSPKSSKPSFDKPKRTRGTDTPKRGGEKTFDSREKYVKGDLKLSKKPFKKFEKDEDKAKSFVQKSNCHFSTLVLTSFCDTVCDRFFVGDA